MDAMKKCPFDLREISRLVDNDLTDDERRSVEAHLESCGDCRRVRDAYTAIGIALTNDIPSVIGTTSVTAPPPAHARFTSWSGVVKLAAMFVGAVALWTIFRHYSTASVTVAPRVFETGSARMMNTPLAAVIYYEEIAGTSVHSQFTPITTSGMPTGNASGVSAKLISGYNSPLFCDSLVLERRCSALNGGRFITD
jgi:hypothetical protein